MNPPAATVPGQAGPPLARRNLIFAIVSIGLFMVSVDQTIVATALTAIQRELHTQINWSSWTITIYSLGQVVAMPMAGKLSDMFGRKRVFLIAVMVFTVASLCCGFAGNIYLLLMARGIQALGGGAFMPSATGIVADHFGAQRDRAVGMFTSIFPIGGIVGPIIGGIFVSYWTWRGIFLVNVPIGIVLVGLVIKFIPANSERVSRRIDVRGIAILTVLILSAMFGITYLGTGDVPLYSPVFLGCEAVALVAGWFFVRHSKRDPAPFVPFALLRGRGFGVMNMINLIYGGAVIGFAALVPLYAQERYHIAALGAGTLLTARAVGMISVASLAVFTMRRTGYRLPMMGGFAILAAGLGLMAVPAPHLALRLAGHRGGDHRLRHGPVRARQQQRQPAAGPGPGRGDRRPARHVPPGRLDHRGLGRHRRHRPQPRSWRGAGARVRGVRPADGGAAAGGVVLRARTPGQLVRRPTGVSGKTGQR